MRLDPLPRRCYTGLTGGNPPAPHPSKEMTVPTTVTLTMGEIFDIQSSLQDRVKGCEEDGDAFLAAYYGKLSCSFDSIVAKLQERPGELREATLVLAQI